MATKFQTQTDKITAAILKQKELAVTLMVVGVICMMVIPLPGIALDILLTAMIALAVIILMVSMYLENVLDFSVFPGLLLIITLFRLSLNVASTRLILSEGHAGAVIDTFGTFVTRGNIVVGVIIFIILVIIQFVVITKGAGRIAEVAARFTLDAMPGKQMAVDADLNAGIITEEEAKKRRRDIGREADFYGAMDGASKFVRGDAIAGIIITLVNVIGGFIVGITMQGMEFTEALSTFTRLTIGDGLVTQTPALMISTASGIIVARAASKSNLGEEVIMQLTQNPRSLIVGGAVVILLGFVPGMPILVFLALGGGMGFIGTSMIKAEKKKKIEIAVQDKQKAAKAESSDSDKIESYLQVDQMELEIGYGLIPLVDVSQGGDLLERITMLRRQCATEIGIIVPPIRIRDNIQLKPNQYLIKIKGVEVGGGELMSGCYLAMDPGGVSQRISGMETIEPAFGLPALWITQSQKESAEIAGYTVVELPAVLATHLTEIIKGHGGEILTRQDVKALVDNVKSVNATVVDELVPSLLSIGEIQKVLVNLLEERISVRDLGTVLEALSTAARTNKSESHLTEACRQALSRQICKSLKDGENTIQVITFEPKLEQILEASVQSTDRGPRLIIRPELVGQLMTRIAPFIEKMMAINLQPVLLCSPNIRFQLRKLLEGTFKNLSIVSYSEISPSIRVKTLGTVVLNENENISG